MKAELKKAARFERVFTVLAMVSGAPSAIRNWAAGLFDA
jgi:hypothetical protein